MKTRLFICAMLALTVVGCERNVDIFEPDNNEGNIVTISATISPETRVSYDGDTGGLAWEEGDQLLLVGFDNSDAYIGNSTFNYQSGNTFSGTPVLGADKYAAYYKVEGINLNETTGEVTTADTFYDVQTQSGSGSTAHLKSKLFLGDDTAKPLTQSFTLSAKNSIIKLALSGIPQEVGNLQQLIYTVETAAGVFKSVELDVTNVTFSPTTTDLTAYIAFNPTVMTGIVAGGTANISLLGNKSYKWGTQVSTAKNYSAGNRYTGTVTTGWNEIINPLSYFAEHNMADLSGTFEAYHDTFGHFLFYWNNAMTYNTTHATLGGKSYYLPTIEEWGAIIPEEHIYVQFVGTDTRTLSDAAVTVGGESYTMSGAFDNVGSVVYATLTYTHQYYPTLYAIARYRGENMRHNQPNARMVVDMQSTATPYTMDQAKNANWGAVGVVSRVFPAAGYRFYDQLFNQGTHGYYWSSTEYDSAHARLMYFSKGGAYSGSYSAKALRFSVRLVSRE